MEVRSEFKVFVCSGIIAQEVPAGCAYHSMPMPQQDPILPRALPAEPKGASSTNCLSMHPIDLVIESQGHKLNDSKIPPGNDTGSSSGQAPDGRRKPFTCYLVCMCHRYTAKNIIAKIWLITRANGR